MVPSSVTAHNLPLQLTSFIGREREIAEVRRLLAMTRLLTLTGLGGCGKTRLAVQVAATASSDYADGVHFVSLAPITEPGLVVSTIVQALGVREQGNRPLLDSLKDQLQDKQVLLLLDNFEQIVSAAPIVTELLVTAPRLKVLVTSRASLHLSGEHEFVVLPLSLPDLRDLPPLDRLIHFEAIQLFIERAQAVQSDFAITEENAAAIAAICQRLDGLPLAIELAAGRSKLFPPQALLPRLRNRLKLLVGGARDLPSRQQTLRGTIAWSYDLLEEPEKRLFGRLAVFVGGCTLAAAEAVCNADGGLEGDILDSVAGLVDKSLLRRETQADGEPRLLMLETIREYALERLAASGEAEAIQRQHATFFLQLAEEADPKVRSAEQASWYRRLEVEHDNLRAALRWTLERKASEMGLRLAGVLWAFWRRHLREGRSWLAQVLAQPGAQARTPARAKALLLPGALALFQGDFLEAGRLLEESVSIGWEVGTKGKRDLAHALMMLGHMVLLQGNLSAARELAEESKRLFQEVGEAWGLAMALSLFGEAMVKLGDPVAARAPLEESVALFRVAGDRQRLVLPIDALGLVALQQGDYADARARFEEALSLARQTGDEPFIADALARLGTVALREGDYQQSAGLYQQSPALNRVLGNRDGIAENMAGLAEVASYSANQSGQRGCSGQSRRRARRATSRCHLCAALSMIVLWRVSASNSTKQRLRRRGCRDELCRWSRPSKRL
jgi:predicted ATPase